MKKDKVIIDGMVHEKRNALKIYTNELESLPAGHLIRCRNNGKPRFYHAYYDNGSYRRKTIDNDDSMKRKLARREYLSRMIEVLKYELKELEQLDDEFMRSDIEVLMKSMPKAYQCLPESYFFDRSSDVLLSQTDDDMRKRCERHVAWANEPYEKSTYKQEGRKFMTSLGFKVRSKSELFIAEENAAMGVPLRYEQIIRLGNKIVVPDFTFQDAKGELFYWEHAGMMDISEYAFRHKRKIELYDSFEIVPWKNLIVTYDMDGIINVPLIKSIVKNDVLPRL